MLVRLARNPSGEACHALSALSVIWHHLQLVVNYHMGQWPAPTSVSEYKCMYCGGYAADQGHQIKLVT